MTELTIQKNNIWQLSLTLLRFIHSLEVIGRNSTKRLLKHAQKLRTELALKHNKNKYNKFVNVHNQCVILEKTLNGLMKLMYDNDELRINGIKAMKQTKEWDIKPSSINNSAKQILEYLIFGYVRELIEDKHNMMIPYYLKMISLEFYGNIIMDTNILNINQLNTFGYVLKSSFDKKKWKHFYTQKIYDSKKDGFDSKLFNEKCGALEYKSIIIVKSNQNHIFAHYQASCTDDDIQTDVAMIGCLLNSAISTMPMIYEFVGSTYHFSDDFEADFNEKLSNVATKCDENKIYPIECVQDINDKIYISDFEIFSVQ